MGKNYFYILIKQKEKGFGEEYYQKKRGNKNGAKNNKNGISRRFQYYYWSDSFY